MWPPGVEIYPHCVRVECQRISPNGGNQSSIERRCNLPRQRLPALGLGHHREAARARAARCPMATDQILFLLAGIVEQMLALVFDDEHAPAVQLRHKVGKEIASRQRKRMFPVSTYGP